MTANLSTEMKTATKTNIVEADVNAKVKLRTCAHLRFWSPSDNKNGVKA